MVCWGEITEPSDSFGRRSRRGPVTVPLSWKAGARPLPRGLGCVLSCRRGSSAELGHGVPAALTSQTRRWSRAHTQPSAWAQGQVRPWNGWCSLRLWGVGSAPLSPERRVMPLGQTPRARSLAPGAKQALGLQPSEGRPSGSSRFQVLPFLPLLGCSVLLLSRRCPLSVLTPLARTMPSVFSAFLVSDYSGARCKPV